MSRQKLLKACWVRVHCTPPFPLTIPYKHVPCNRSLGDLAMFNRFAFTIKYHFAYINCYYSCAIANDPAIGGCPNTSRQCSPHQNWQVGHSIHEARELAVQYANNSAFNNIAMRSKVHFTNPYCTRTHRVSQSGTDHGDVVGMFSMCLSSHVCSYLAHDLKHYRRDNNDVTVQYRNR